MKANLEGIRFANDKRDGELLLFDLVNCCWLVLGCEICCWGCASTFPREFVRLEPFDDVEEALSHKFVVSNNIDEGGDSTL